MAPILMKNQKVKVPKVLIFSVLFLLLILAGCNKSAPVQAPQDSPASGQQLSDSSAPASQQKVDLKQGEITDPVELEKLWQEYLYDGISTIFNTLVFNSAEEIDPVDVAHFCFDRYISEHGQDSLALAGEGGYDRLIPLYIVQEYAMRYFNLTSLDVAKVPDYYYDPGKRAFTFATPSKHQARPSYRNSFGDQLDKVTKNNDGTLTVILVRYRIHSSDSVELTMTYTLQERADGSLYFVNGRWEFINNHLVALTGEYKRFDKIIGYEGNMDQLSMVGEVEGRLILVDAPYDTGKTSTLLLVDPETFTVEKQLNLDEKLEKSDVKLSGDKLVVCLKNKIMLLNTRLEHLEDIPLPQAITEKMERTPKFDKYNRTEIFFGGYDVSKDLTKLVYADEEGLKLYNLVDQSERLLAKTVEITGSDLLKNSFHMAPRFVDDAKKVISTMTGYDGYDGFTLCNLEKGTSKNLGIDSNGFWTGNIRYDTGLLIVNTFNNAFEKKYSSEPLTLYFDFKTESLNRINLENPGETGMIRMADSSYLGQNQAAFITYKLDVFDNANNISYLNRLNMQTFKVEPGIISVKAAGTHILGVLRDGRIVFWYNLNPSENGICITK